MIAISPISCYHLPMDILSIDPRELRDTIRVTIDRELIEELDRERASVSRSRYLEMVL